MNESPPEPARILVVDDTPENLELLESFLHSQGYQVFAVPNGEMALRAASRHHPDLVLLDILMPGLNGYEVCAHLQSDPALREVPVIFLSALDAPGDKVRAFEAGAVDYLTKPLQMEEVRARVRTHLELSRRKRELQANYDRLLELERLRDSLTHLIVHDLRSPLTVIDLNLELLNDLTPPGDPARFNPLAAAQAHVRRLAEMINQLLDVNRLEAGEMPIHRTPGDLARLVRTVLTSLVPLTGQRQVRLPAATPVPVLAAYDAELIARVLANLLLNAFRYTPERAEVAVSVQTEGDFVRLAITDRGPGIAPELQGRIFEKFGPVESRRRPTGLGIGLAFCRLAIEAHGGRIGLTSPPGEGNTFWFTLPINPPPPAPSSAAA